MPWIGKILDALIALPKIADQVEKVVAAITLWWISRQNAETARGIADAAALQAHAKTEEDRYAAAQAWQDVFHGRSRNLGK